MNPFRNVYIYFALVVPVAIFAFWKTYFGILGNLPETITPLVHVHALLTFLWLLMLIAQAWFIRTKRFRTHRWVGRSSYVIAPLIILLGLAVLHKAYLLSSPASMCTPLVWCSPSGLRGDSRLCIVNKPPSMCDS